MQLPVRLHKRFPETHKGDYGYVFVLGGSTGLTGAVCLCAQAALRCGCGLVTAGVPKSLNTIFEIKLTEVMTMPLAQARGGCLSKDAFKQIIGVLKKVDVFAIGEEQLRKGYLDANTIFDVTGMCKKAIEIIPKLAAGEKFTEDIKIKGPVYTPDNVDDPELQEQLWELAKV